MRVNEQANLEVTLSGLHLDRTSDTPLHRQLESALRAFILAGHLPNGARLPPSRDIARHLRISRTTVLDALDVLSAEGYLRGRTGQGTFVTATPRTTPSNAHRGTPSTRGQQLAALPATPAVNARRWPPRAFLTGTPDVTAFPWQEWARLESRNAQATRHDLGYGDPAGYGPLREVIAAYLNASRAMHCTPEQIIIVTGSQQGLDLIARTLLDHGDEALMEDPGYLGARAAFLGAGLSVTPVPVDAQGLDIEAGAGRAPRARLAYVTPAHQYPLGVVMSAQRRLALLDWAHRHDGWIIEDDYDGEYRYGSAPLHTLHALDTDARVIHVGTFSKVLFPGLRIGYLVVPAHLAGTFRAVKRALDRANPILTSATLADFIAHGHFARHLRRTRRLYQARNAALLAQQSRFGCGLTLQPSEAGLHLTGFLPDGADDIKIARRAWQVGVDVNPLTAYAALPTRPGLVLGYAAVSETEIDRGARALASVLP